MLGLPSEQLPHGGDLDAARARFPQAPKPWIDLSTGINPRPYPLPALELDVWARLPQASAERALRQAVACRYGAAHEDMVVCAPGTQALIQLLPRLVPRGQVAIMSPTYAEHAAAWGREGHHVRDVAPAAEIEGAQVLIVVNPNNPTGHEIPRSHLQAYARVLQARGGLLVVDEAFADTLPASASLVPDLPPSAIVLRSFGKMYGLAGLRLGFAIAHAPLAARLRTALGPWAVAGPALSIGLAALKDEAWQAEALRWLAVSQKRLDALLSRAGCHVLGGTLLFRLVQHTRAQQLADVLGAHGIHVRRFEAQPHWIRFGMPGDEEAWARLHRALGLDGAMS